MEIILRDSARVVMDSWVETLTLRPEDGEAGYPADDAGGKKIMADIARELECHVREGLACSIEIRPICTFPGCEAPTGTIPTLCDSCAEATL